MIIFFVSNAIAVTKMTMIKFANRNATVIKSIIRKIALKLKIN